MTFFLRSLSAAVVGLALGISLTGCTSTPESEITYASGTDVRAAGRGLAEKFLNDRWISDFKSRERREPQVRVGQLKLASDMPTDSAILVGDFQEQLYNSKNGKFLAERSALDQAATEREDEAGRDPTQASKKSARLKADFVLTGIFTYQRSGPKEVLYRAKLDLLNTDTEEIVPKVFDVVYKDGKRVE